MAEPILEVRKLRKSFGGVHAVDGLDMAVAPNQIHAVIGPNGAGKTTLISLLSGAIFADGGEIVFKGREISRSPAYKRSHMGLARSFQITSVFLEFTALQNVSLAVQAHCGHSFRFWRNAAAEQELREPALAALARVGLDNRAEIVASNMSHGEHRQLEIAMALATRPTMLLLDEPMAGMGPDESARVVELIGNLRREQTILLVEHDMDAVFALADVITVMVYGKAIASGPPKEIRSNPQVVKAYLGEEAASAGFAAG